MQQAAEHARSVHHMVDVTPEVAERARVHAHRRGIGSLGTGRRAPHDWSRAGHSPLERACEEAAGIAHHHRAPVRAKRRRGRGAQIR